MVRMNDQEESGSGDTWARERAGTHSLGWIYAAIQLRMAYSVAGPRCLRREMLRDWFPHYCVTEFPVSGLPCPRPRSCSFFPILPRFPDCLDRSGALVFCCLSGRVLRYYAVSFFTLYLKLLPETVNMHLEEYEYLSRHIAFIIRLSFRFIIIGLCLAFMVLHRCIQLQESVAWTLIAGSS